MNKIEVDPRLFITCRLCLEELGVYQIAPIVKEQIIYCFDINVEPFDGLPQLICKKCEAILSNFAATKRTLIEKQNDLRSKMKGSQNGQVKVSQYEPVPLDSIENLENNGLKLCMTKKRKAVSSSDSECDRTYEQNANESNNEESPESWTEKFTKHYVCRICNLQWSDMKSLKSHISSRHKTLKRKYSNIFKKHCEVKLYATDGKPNVTGSKRKVMHNKNKIIENVDPNYYIKYTSKDYEEKECTDEDNSEEPGSNTNKTVKNKHYESSDSSDDEIIVAKSKRVRRICSRSSNETVVLDTDNKLNTSDEKGPQNLKNVQVGECINIDDSTDSDSEIPQPALEIEKDMQVFASTNKADKPDQTTITEIINTCQNKYIKKHYLDDSVNKSKDPSDIAKQLKRKILSIGRKVINKKKGVSCTPLLRFMELKNLDIAWIPRSTIYSNQDSNCIRIMTRMKNIGENVDCETGWIDYVSSSTSHRTYTQISGISSNSNKVNNIVETSDKELITVSNRTQPEIPQTSTHKNVHEDTLDGEVLIADANLTGADTKKLLNENPVANPKQLPKKPANETKAVKVTATKQSMPNIEVTPQENDDLELYMPIITSTTSLAPPLSIEDNYDDSRTEIKNTHSKNDGHKSEVPRIKVKPVSELMSAETLNRMQEPDGTSCIISKPVQNDNSIVNIYEPQISPTPQVQIAANMHMNNSMGLASAEPAWKNEFMILDTIDLPNTSTNSPFQYFKKLLQMHNIKLLNTDVELSPEYQCLIKFKVLYKQESNNQPVILCLALYCSKNKFCMKVKDRNQENINLSRISPNWQWEVLKIYKGEVVNKLLSNAQKVGQDVYECVINFNIKESADALFNNIQYMYIRKNGAMSEVFVGCVSRVEFDDKTLLKIQYCK